MCYNFNCFYRSVLLAFKILLGWSETRFLAVPPNVLFRLRTGRVTLPPAGALALRPCTFDPLLLGLYYNLSYVNAR